MCMSNDSEPTESYDGSLTVRLLDDDEGREDVRCSSYNKAIEVVKDNRYSTTVVKIIDKDGDVVFDSLDRISMIGRPSGNTRNADCRSKLRSTIARTITSRASPTICAFSVRWTKFRVNSKLITCSGSSPYVGLIRDIQDQRLIFD